MVTSIIIKAIGGLTILISMIVMLVLFNSAWVALAFYLCSLPIIMFLLDMDYMNFKDIFSIMAFSLMLLPLFAITGIALVFRTYHVIEFCNDITSYR